MGRWLDLAARLDEGAEPRAVSAVSAVWSVPAVGLAPIGTNDPNGTGALPDAVTDGLTSLLSMRAPAGADPQLWSVAVADALRLVEEGWARQALALGWHPLHLWGSAPSAGDPALDGLAVWLGGRRVLLVDEGSCIVADGERRREVFNRRPIDGAVLLWELGREKAGG